MKTLNKLLILLSVKERKQAIFLLVMILLMALLDALGVASIMPFIAVLANPDLIQTNILINNIFNYSSIIGVKTNEQFLFTLGLFVFFFASFYSYFQSLFNLFAAALYCNVWIWIKQAHVRKLPQSAL